MRWLAVIFLILSFCSVANADYEFAENWTKTDSAYQASFVAITTVDWMQTRWMARNDWKWDGKSYHETNPLLGKHPSERTVDIMVPLGILAHTMIAMAIPPPKKNDFFNFRRIWQCLFIGVEGAVIYNNYQLGVQLEF